MIKFVGLLRVLFTGHRFSNYGSQVYIVAEEEGWEPTGKLKAMVADMFACVGQTGIIENAFQVERRSEESSYNRRMSQQRMWGTLLETQPATRKHNFDDIPDWESEAIPRGFKDRDTSMLHHASAKDASMDLKGIVGPTASPVWHSAAPLNGSAPYGDMHLASLCHQSGQWGEATDRWLGFLLKDPRVLVRNRKVLGETWYFPLSDAGSPAKYCWPAEVVRLGQQDFYTLKADAKLEELPFLHVTSLPKWEALELEWQSPLAVELRCPGCNAMGVLGMPIGKPMPLLRFAASKAFFDIPKTALLQLARYLGSPWDPADDLLTRVKMMVVHVLGPPCSNSVAQPMLGKQCL